MISCRIDWTPFRLFFNSIMDSPVPPKTNSFDGQTTWQRRKTSRELWVVLAMCLKANKNACLASAERSTAIKIRRSVCLAPSKGRLSISGGSCREPRSGQDLLVFMTNFKTKKDNKFRNGSRNTALFPPQLSQSDRVNLWSESLWPNRFFFSFAMTESESFYVSRAPFNWLLRGRFGDVDPELTASFGFVWGDFFCPGAKPSFFLKKNDIFSPQPPPLSFPKKFG